MPLRHRHAYPAALRRGLPAAGGRGNLIVSEAFGGTASALSSYDLSPDGELNVISPSVAAGTEKAACWVVVTKNGRYAYTTNTASGTVSSYTIRHNGTLQLANAQAASVGGAPIDAAITGNGRFLYVLNAALNRIDGLQINSDGTLAAVAAGITGLPAGTNGLAAS